MGTVFPTFLSYYLDTLDKESVIFQIAFGVVQYVMQNSDLFTYLLIACIVLPYLKGKHSSNPHTSFKASCFDYGSLWVRLPIAETNLT